MTDVEYYLKYKKMHRKYSFVADCGFPRMLRRKKGHCIVLMETVSAVEGIREFDGGTAPNSVPSFGSCGCGEQNRTKERRNSSGNQWTCSFSGWNSKCNRYTLWKVENAKFS